MILLPFFSPWHAPFVQAACAQVDGGCRVACSYGEETVRRGLELVNNDACYGALLAAGQVVSSLGAEGAGRADSRADGAAPADACVAVVVPVPCVRCRADDGPYLVAQALRASGAEGTRVLGAEEAFARLLPEPEDAARVADAIAAGDVLLQAATRMRPYLTAADRIAFGELVASGKATAIDALAAGGSFDLRAWAEGLDAAARCFGAPARDGRPIVGVVGSAPAVFNEGMNARLAAAIEREGCEVALPYFAPLAAYALRERGVGGSLLIALEERCRLLSRPQGLRRPCPTLDDLERSGTVLVPRHVVQGAGWTIAGQAALFVEEGVHDLVYARLFGCLAGHVVGQGVVKRLRELGGEGLDGAPVNVTSVEFDPGTSNVNQVNRIKLMAAVAKRTAQRRDLS